MLYNTQNPHGGDVYGAAVALDFSSNVHPLGTPPGVVEAIRAAAAQVRQYPDPYCRALNATIAAHEGVPQPYVLCGGGAAELIYAYCDALRPRLAAEFAPTFSEYRTAAAHFGAQLAQYPLRAPDFLPDEGLLAFLKERKPDVLFLCTPNNPTGVVYSAETLTRLAEILTAKSKEYGHNIFLVSDEPYRDIAFDGKKVPYPAAFYPHTLTCFSFSKSLSLPGERLGYVAVRPGCEGEDVLVDMMAQISRFTGHNCPPSIIQRAVSRCQDVTSDLSVYETNMNLLYDKLTALGFEVERPGGTFYIFPKALEEDANAFCLKAREFDLLLVPSDTFGVKGYVRFAYCIDTEKVKRSLPALEKLAAAYKK